MPVITCATCGEMAEPHTLWGPIAICNGCGETLVITDDGTTRKALGTDIDQMSPEALAHLRLGLKAFRQTKRAAHG
jgi:hypothetical protein